MASGIGSKMKRIPRECYFLINGAPSVGLLSGADLSSLEASAVLAFGLSYSLNTEYHTTPKKEMITPTTRKIVGSRSRVTIDNTMSSASCHSDVAMHEHRHKWDFGGSEQQKARQTSAC